MNSKSDENQQLKSNLIVRIAILVALPVAALSLQTIRVEMLSGTIREATSVETLARSARDNYKAFVDRVVDAVDTGTVSTHGLQYLGEAGKSLRQLHSLRDDGDLAALDANLQEQLDKLIADPSLNGLMQIRPKINTANICCTIFAYSGWAPVAKFWRR